MKKRFLLLLPIILGFGFAAAPNSNGLRFVSRGEVRELREVPISDVRAERFRNRRVQIWKVDSRTRFVTLDDNTRTDLEFWTLEPSGWRVSWHEALIEEKDFLADQHPGFAGVVPQLVQIGPKDFALGVLTSRSTGYSGGGGMNTYLNLYRTREPGLILSDSLIASGKLIRACFSEADYNSGGPCHDEYDASSVLKFFGLRNGMFRLKKYFSVEMQPAFRKPSDPSGDTPQADRVGVCAPYNLEYEWNSKTLAFDSLWPEPDSCAL